MRGFDHLARASHPGFASPPPLRGSAGARAFTERASGVAEGRGDAREAVRYGDGDGNGGIREAGEGGRGHVRQGVQGARQAHGAAGGAQEDAPRDGGGRRPVHGAARGVAAADVVSQHLHCEVRTGIACCAT